MKEFKLVSVSPEEFMKQCKQRVKKDGLYKAVKEELDELVDLAHGYGYLQFSETMERADTILKLIEAAETQNN